MLVIYFFCIILYYVIISKSPKHMPCLQWYSFVVCLNLLIVAHFIRQTNSIFNCYCSILVKTRPCTSREFLLLSQVWYVVWKKAQISDQSMNSHKVLHISTVMYSTSRPVDSRNWQEALIPSQHCRVSHFHLQSHVINEPRSRKQTNMSESNGTDIKKVMGRQSHVLALPIRNWISSNNNSYF